MGSTAGMTAGAALFVRLKALGVDYVFANSGTDFPPIIEGLIEARRRGLDLPIPVTVPHEHAAVSMAHGYYQMTGRAQAVMLHTNVGLANAATGAINAACDQVPMILMSGRTPVTEGGRFGARTVPIGWGQEMFDQTALVREAVKWEYELKVPEQICDLLDRAHAIANSTPKGPVYLSLPREVLCEQTPARVSAPVRLTPVQPAPTPDALEQAARMLAGARNPVIVSQRGAGSEAAFRALSGFLTNWAVPLCHYWPNQVSVPMDHPMQVGTDPAPWLEQADVVLVINALAPWWPDRVSLPETARVIQLGPDPLHSRTPVRNFPADLTLPGEIAPTVLALIAAMDQQHRDADLIASRRARVMQRADKMRAASTARAEQGNGAPMTKEWVSLCLGRAIRAQAIKGRTATVFHELGCPIEALGTDQHLGYVQEPYSGGLGWGLPAALGAQLADPDRLIFATMGDGSYMFANPTVCHMLAEGLGLPIITLILNNEEWGAVRKSAEGLYPHGQARLSNDVPLTSLRPSPDFTLTALASRAYSETVTDGADLPDALERAIDVATRQRRQVLLNIAIARETAP